ncbi:MAG: YgaP family membrane protein [Gemmatimonadota bacterium]
MHDARHYDMLVRRFAGVFVLISLALGWWVSPYWFLFTAFVGLNLLQSSFTRFCPLEIVLRKAGEQRTQQ